MNTNKTKILVVDYNAIPRQAITNVLEEEGYKVITANNGLEALEIFKESKFDLVITGIKMPKMDGLTFLQNLKKIAPQTPVIVLTAYASLETARDAVRMGAHDYLIKPFDKEKLLSSIKDALKVSEKEEIVICPNCLTKNRIRAYSSNKLPVCGRCKSSLIKSDSSRTNSNREDKTTPKNKSAILFYVAALLVVCCAIILTSRFLTVDFSDLIESENQKTSLLIKKQDKFLSDLEIKLNEELSAVDANKLRQKALRSYRNILDARSSFDMKYALTQREKALLNMRNLSSDSNKSYHQAIKAVAKEASPQGAEIKVSESSSGISLFIDFDMSSMTSGESGTRTKHNTKESLKKEVGTLISRVTNDVYQFCKTLDLKKIYIGCRHYVRTQYSDGSEKNENTILYKVFIETDKIAKLSNNPFLDTYSTKKYFQVQEDNFSDIEIVFTRQ